MSDRDPFQDLHELARYGEEHATGLPAHRVRRLGAQRRHRRHSAIAVTALAAALLGGGVVWSQTGLHTDRTPDFAATPTAVPATTRPTADPTTSAPTEPERTVTPANLMTVDDLPVLAEERWAQSRTGVGRPAEAITTCIPDGRWTVLGVTGMVSRNFRLDRRSDGSLNRDSAGFDAEPTVYTQALQFRTEAAAEKAYLIVQDWLADCRTTIDDRGDEALGADKPVWMAVSGANSGFSEVTWREKGGDPSQGYFESVGLARVGDRLAVTVSLTYGEDHNVSMNEEGDPSTELPAHPQFTLVKSARTALSQ